MVRAAHLQLSKDESIEDVLQKLECTSSTSSNEKPSKATPGKKLFASQVSGVDAESFCIGFKEFIRYH